MEDKKYLSVKMPIGDVLQLVEEARNEKSLTVNFALFDNENDYVENKNRPRFKAGNKAAFLNTYKPKKDFTEERVDTI